MYKLQQFATKYKYHKVFLTLMLLILCTITIASSSEITTTVPAATVSGKEITVKGPGGVNKTYVTLNIGAKDVPPQVKGEIHISVGDVDCFNWHGHNSEFMYDSTLPQPRINPIITVNGVESECTYWNPTGSLDCAEAINNTVIQDGNVSVTFSLLMLIRSKKFDQFDKCKDMKPKVHVFFVIQTTPKTQFDIKSDDNTFPQPTLDGDYETINWSNVIITKPEPFVYNSTMLSYKNNGNHKNNNQIVNKINIDRNHKDYMSVLIHLNSLIKSTNATSLIVTLDPSLPYQFLVHMNETDGKSDTTALNKLRAVMYVDQDKWSDGKVVSTSNSNDDEYNYYDGNDNNSNNVSNDDVNNYNVGQMIQNNANQLIFDNIIIPGRKNNNIKFDNVYIIKKRTNNQDDGVYDDDNEDPLPLITITIPTWDVSLTSELNIIPTKSGDFSIDGNDDKDKKISPGLKIGLIVGFSFLLFGIIMFIFIRFILPKIRKWKASGYDDIDQLDVNRSSRISNSRL